MGVRRQLVLRLAAPWRPRAFKNSCLVTSAPAESECRSCGHIPQTPAGATFPKPQLGSRAVVERGAETAEGVMSSATTHPDWGSGCGSAPNQPIGLPVPPQDHGLLTRWAPWGVITHPTQQGLRSCSVACWLKTLVSSCMTSLSLHFLRDKRGEHHLLQAFCAGYED